ncbi:TlpA family protein disulfide reductase [Persephonella sp.]
MKKVIISFLLITFISTLTFGKGLRPYNFTLKDEYGNTVTLSDLKGNVIFLIFWSTTCHTCEQELPVIYKLSKKYNGKPVKFFAIVINTKDINDIKDIKRKWKFEIPVLIGDSLVMSKYRIRGTPIIYILRKDLTIGKILYGSHDTRKYEKYINKFLKEN